MDRLMSMAVFVKAVELGSFAAVADAFSLSGPMVGKHIRSLEERLGVKLLHRTTRRQSLTDFGRIYYERCRVVLAEAEAADALAANQHSTPRGKLRVTMPVHFGRHCVAPVLRQMVREYPELELDLSFNDRSVDMVEEGFDLAIRTGKLEDRAGIMARLVARQPMVVCAAPSYVAQHGTLQRMEDITGHTAVMYWRSGHMRPWVFPQQDASLAEIMPQYRLRFDDLDAIADAVEEGIGLAWLPYWLVQKRIQAGTLVEVVPEQPPFLYDVHVLWLKTAFMPQKVRLAIDALASALPKQME